jgi:chromate transporter
MESVYKPANLERPAYFNECGSEEIDQNRLSEWSCMIKHTIAEEIYKGHNVQIMNEDKPSIGWLFLDFLRLGLTAFGGPSMVAYIRKLAVERRNWLNKGEFSDGVALCQMIPGATAMQTAAYVGLRLRGVLGAAATFIGFGLPAFALMLFFAIVYAKTGTLPAVVSAFSGLQAVIVAIIVNAALSFGKATIKNWKYGLISVVAAVMFWANIHPLIVILAAAGLGWLVLPHPSEAELRGSQSEATPFYKRSLVIILLVTLLGVAGLYYFSRDLFSLALLMFRVDLMAFGGGFASVPIMYHEVVEANHWLNGQTFMNGMILGQVTPGPVVITATFIGYMLKGIFGAIVASISIFMPSFLLVTGIAPFFNRLSVSPVFHKIIRGVLCSFVGLLVSVAIRFGLQVQWDVVHVVLAAGALTALLFKVDILWVVLGGTLLSIGFIR